MDTDRKHDVHLDKRIHVRSGPGQLVRIGYYDDQHEWQTIAAMNRDRASMLAADLCSAESRSGRDISRLAARFIVTLRPGGELMNRAIFQHPDRAGSTDEVGVSTDEDFDSWCSLLLRKGYEAAPIDRPVDD